MTIITATTWGTVYLLHLHAPLGNLANKRAQAQHYIGFALDLDARLAEHRRGGGSKLLAAAVGRGIAFTVVATWNAPLAFEKTLKRRKEAPKLCPVCTLANGQRCKQIQPPTHQQLVLPLDDGADMPDVAIATKMDWFEMDRLKRFRATRATLRPLVALATDWDSGLL